MWEWGCSNQKTLVGEVWTFSGSTHYLDPHLWQWIRQQTVQFVWCTVPHSTPPGSLVIEPHPAKTYSQPLSQGRVRICQLLQTDGNQVALNTSFLGMKTKKNNNKKKQH